VITVHKEIDGCVLYTVKKMHPILDAKCNKTKFPMQFH
jgi:hypothetical protein